MEILEDSKWNTSYPQSQEQSKVRHHMIYRVQNFTHIINFYFPVSVIQQYLISIEQWFSFLALSGRIVKQVSFSEEYHIKAT